MAGVCTGYADTRNLSIKDLLSSVSQGIYKCIPSAFLHFGKQVLPQLGVLFYLCYTVQLGLYVEQQSTI